MASGAESFWSRGSERFRQIAGEPGSFYARRAALVATLLGRHLAAGRTLDVGCGDGRLCRLLAAGGFDSHGIDLSAAQIARAVALAEGTMSDPHRRFQVGSIETVPFGGPFDAVTAIGLLPYVADHPAFLRGLAGQVRPGGLLAVSCTNAVSLFTIKELAGHIGRFRPTAEWRTVASNLLHTGVWSGGFVDRRTARQCRSAGALDALCRRCGLVRVATLDLYNLDWGGLDARPLQRSRIGRAVARRLGWTHVGLYRRGPVPVA